MSDLQLADARALTRRKRLESSDALHEREQHAAMASARTHAAWRDREREREQERQRQKTSIQSIESGAGGTASAAG